MSVESSRQEQDDGAFAPVQKVVGPDAELTSVDSLTTEIAILIEETNSLHQHDYVVGEVADYGIDASENVHFKLVHRTAGRENRKDDRLHCIIYENRRPNITASIREGQQVAVSGDLSLYAPRSRCSIEVDDVVVPEGDDSSHPFEMIRTDRRIRIALATVVLFAVLVIVSLLLL